MSLQFSHDEPATPESAQQARQLLEDQQWYAEHSQELHDRFAGLFVAIAGGEPFAATTREAAFALAKQRKPDRDPIVFFLPKERKLSVYDLPRSCDTPVLGRDVLDSFRLIFDRSRNTILLLSSPHDYDVVIR